MLHLYTRRRLYLLPMNVYNMEKVWISDSVSGTEWSANDHLESTLAPTAKEFQGMTQRHTCRQTQRTQEHSRLPDGVKKSCQLSSCQPSATAASTRKYRGRRPWRGSGMVGKGEVRRGNYILHELLADGANILAEGGAEHHHLLLVGCHTEDLLHITTHICNKPR